MHSARTNNVLVFKCPSFKLGHFYYWKFCLWLTNFKPCDWSIVCQDCSEAAKRTSVQQLMIAAYNAAYKGSWSLPMFVVYTARFTVQVYTY